jgi:hypothetical protein
VHVKLHPYRQTSLAGSKYHELSKRYYGPYLILERIGIRSPTNCPSQLIPISTTCFIAHFSSHTKLLSHLVWISFLRIPLISHLGAVAWPPPRRHFMGEVG